MENFINMKKLLEKLMYPLCILLSLGDFSSIHCSSKLF